MMEKINKFTESIIIAPNKPFYPKKNRFGFIEIPYVKLLILAGDTEIENLGYSWSCTGVTSTAMIFELIFENPLEISMQDSPDQV